MKKPKPVAHIHTYKRTRTKAYNCTDPTCFHSQPRHMLGGKLAKCPYCTTTFIITSNHLRRANIWCLACDKLPLDKELAKIGADPEILNQLANDSTANIFRDLLKGA